MSAMHYCALLKQGPERLSSQPAVQALARLPENLKSNPIFLALLNLSASVSERKYKNIYPRTEELHVAIQNSPISGADMLTVVEGRMVGGGRHGRSAPSRHKQQTALYAPIFPRLLESRLSSPTPPTQKIVTRMFSGRA